MTKNSFRSVLYSPNNLVFKRNEDFYIVLNPDAPNIMVIDDFGREFLQLCNGTRNIDEIIKYMHNEYGPEKAAKKEITEFTSALVKAGFLDTKPLSPLKKEVRQPEKLNQLYLHLTHGCNLRCKHCYVSAGVPFENEMSATETLGLVKEFAELGGEHLIITGGEPLLKKELLYQVIEKAKASGIKKINLESNGILITKKDAEICKEHEVKVGVSLDGATPESNRYIRGPETFQKAINGIKNLVDAEVDTTIGMTLMQPNIHETEEMVYLTKRLGVASIAFSTLKILGRTKENPDLIILPNILIATLRKAWETARKLGVKTSVDEVFLDLKDLKRKEKCGAGVTLFSIAANGNVYPCNAFQEVLSVGNIRKQSLRDIWEKSQALQDLRKLSVLDIVGCRDCELKFICGGCPAESFQAYKSFDKPSPHCSVYKEIYWTVIAELSCELWQEA